MCDACRERKRYYYYCSDNGKMEELIEMVQLVEEEENKEEKKEDNRGSFQWQDTLIRKVRMYNSILYDTLVFSLASTSW